MDGFSEAEPAVTRNPPTPALRGRNLWLRQIAGRLLQGYRLIVSPMLLATFGPACRFEPTCARYAHQAILRHGLGRGGWFALQRLGRCRPGGGWGYDPVPPRRSADAASRVNRLTS